MPELKIVFGVGNVDAIGEKTCLQAKAAFFPSEMLFFHGEFPPEKWLAARKAYNAHVIDEPVRSFVFRWVKCKACSSPVVDFTPAPLPWCALPAYLSATYLRCRALLVEVVEH